MLRLVEQSVAAPLPATWSNGWASNESPYEFARRSLKNLQIDCVVNAESLGRIPARGRTIFVANHPFGALDGLLALAVLGSVRPDLRLLASSDLAVVPELSPLMFGVDPFSKRHSAQRNAQALRYAMRWLEHEHAVLAFPAGDVAGFDARARCVTDPPWSTAIGQVVKMTGARVVPVHISGANSTLFQVAGFLSPQLRRFMLPREMRRQRRQRITVQIGAPIPAERIGRFHDNEAASMHLRLKTFLAASQSNADIESPGTDRAWEDLASEMPADALASEIGALPAQNLLLEQGDLQVFLAEPDAIPHTLGEIGRLREQTFRASCAGTRRARDLDRFDRFHEHLFVWHRSRRELVGAQRIGRSEDLRARHDKAGFSTTTDFKLRDPFLRLLGPALELGRIFVRAEYQRSFALSLLWKGIGEMVGRDPRYCRLIGSVGLGRNYTATSRQLMMGFLRTHCSDPMISMLVSARSPIVRSRALAGLATELALLSNLDPLGALIEDIEPDGKGIPVLLRQYVKLGARVLGFTADAHSGFAMECLMMVDLRHTKPRTLSKYLSKSALARFDSMHRR